ncbi:hypothetical protein PRIPAC_82758 [Pristionchus pacificus]|uniref:Uncharacterized protein n=1 Tax=Pristionchus pacificus TaxID=54126 RepID=A0A2A6BWJ9_PRIPA|nr:hypothetical protein PRIPAC_82758 [Pristionchus pacificus]|eukprot:PDM70290.1 hypothetical protein PRIPAC_46536 [Pristionchus pacificus]
MGSLLSTTNDSPAETHFCLDDLPRELIWMILEHASGAALNLSMASSILNSHVTHYASRQLTIKLVDELKFSYNPLLTAQSVLVVSLTVPAHKASLFEYRLKFHIYANQLTRKREESEENPHFDYSLHLKEKSINFAQIEFLKDLIGQRVGQITLIRCDLADSLENILVLLEGVHSRGMYVWMDEISDKAANDLMDLTMTLSADQISLSAIVFTISDAVGYLLNLSKLVRSMKIVQCLMPGIAYPAEQCLFSVQGADWPSIFVEMFSNRLEKLYILNDMVTEYLSTKSAKFLGKGLPELGKKIWFDASWLHVKDVSYVYRDHHIENYPYRQRLSIKHVSRKAEYFDDN